MGTWYCIGRMERKVHKRRQKVQQRSKVEDPDEQKHEREREAHGRGSLATRTVQGY